jgi:hypothetical protein
MESVAVATQVAAVVWVVRSQAAVDAVMMD